MSNINQILLLFLLKDIIHTAYIKLYYISFITLQIKTMLKIKYFMYVYLDDTSISDISTSFWISAILFGGVLGTVPGTTFV